MKMKILLLFSFVLFNFVMVTVADSTINCYKCANSSALAEHDWRIFNITIDPYAYKPCAPKFDHNILEIVQCNFCASIVDKSTQKRKIIYRGCFDKKIRLEEKRKINGERRFHVMVTCQRSLCNSAIGFHSKSYDSFFGRLWNWFRISDTRIDNHWLGRYFMYDQLIFIICLQIYLKKFYLTNSFYNFIPR